MVPGESLMVGVGGGGGESLEHTGVMLIMGKL